MNDFAALALCTLLLVCVGCGETSSLPSSGEETPSQAVPSPDPTPTPELTLSPETSYFPNSDPPGAVHLVVDTGIFTITNAEGQTLTYDGELTGTIDVLELGGITEVKAGRLGLTMWVPYSDHFTYERPEAPGENELWNIAVAGFPNDSFRQYFAADGGGLGGGSVERVEYDASGSLLVHGEPGNGLVGLTLALPDNDVLGKNGWMKLTAMIGSEGEIRLEGRGDIVRFSGLDPRLVLLAYGPGYVADLNLEIGTGLGLEVGSGTLDLSRVAEGQIILQEDGCEARILGMAE